ncbi:hypothetical protein M9H77_18156 [Catharanthus roseus]|uniref:Uncharacterized protein n=1 Tax=Catharanthus roseus TaxID=4058 RepID=A0ACC0B6Z0_CATRO|nr:hypothetical protein M9H77_18156 [Catharanthus roseus]
MASLSLCSSLASTATLSQCQKQISTSSSLSPLSLYNFNFLSHSFSSLKLTSSPERASPFLFVPKFSQTETAPPLAEPESANQVLEIPVQEQPRREEVFAVVMIGSRQYIVFPGRYIYTQRLKGANVNDKIILNKVLLVGTKTSTYIGKPVVQNAAVHAVVEEQLLDKKVIVFKYKKKKNYRRNIGHRQPITRIRIMGITGYENSPAVTLP